ncbi:hypothetical protein CCOS2040_16065 [Streptomyces albidoflavus]|nr:hypothetical protein CCOS2040_16065 [Streptomyces albidoflavus]
MQLGRADRLAPLPEGVEQGALAVDEVRFGLAPFAAPPKHGQGGGVALIGGEGAHRLAPAGAPGVVPGEVTGVHRGEGGRFGRGEPARRHVGGEVGADGAQHVGAGPHQQPDGEAEDRDHHHGVDGDEAEGAHQGGRAVPQAVHAHGEQQPGQGEQDPAHPSAARGAGGQTEADPGQQGEERVGEGRQHDPYEEGGGGDRGHAAVAGQLVAAEGVPEVEDVLGEGEAGAGEACRHGAVQQAAEVLPAEEEDQEHRDRLGGLLDDGGHEGGADRVGLQRLVTASERLQGGADQPFGGQGVGDDGDQRGGAGSPGEAEDQVPPRAGLDRLHPAEDREQQRHRQQGEAEADEEAVRTGLLADQGEDDAARDREQADQQAHPDRVPLPPAHAGERGRIRGHRRRGRQRLAGTGALGTGPVRLLGLRGRVRRAVDHENDPNQFPVG